jgi:hypothetical protein
VPDVIAVADKAATASSTYFLFDRVAFAAGAVLLSNVIELTPVTAFVDATTAISPTERPVLTLKFLVVMVHSPA